jgi:aquaporin Z
MMDRLRRHWPEYLMEAALLGLFMVSACLATALLEHPASPVVRAVPFPMARMLLIGLAMGGTFVLLARSPWGKRSGAHMNPSATLTFLRLGKVNPVDAGFYVLFQFLGGIAGVQLAALILGKLIRDPSINYIVTMPGAPGPITAWIAEAMISFGMMTLVLNLTASKDLARYTPFFAGALVAVYVTLEAPLSGMSMNPARTLGSAFSAAAWSWIWVYFTAPPLGMLVAAEVFLRMHGEHRVACAKLHHQNHHRCIHCGFPGHLRRGAAVSAAAEGQALS